MALKEAKRDTTDIFLTDIEKMNYISDYMVISTEYAPTSEKYIKAMIDLNSRYNIIIYYYTQHNQP